MAVDPEKQPITLKTLMLWGSIFVSVVGAIGTAVGYYIGLRLDVTIAQHDIAINQAAIIEIRRDQQNANAKITEMDKKLTEVVTILRRLDPAKTSAAKYPPMGEE